MLHYRDGRPVHVGDHVVHGTATAIVEQIIEGDEVTSWDLAEPGGMLVCDECGRVLITPRSADWEDVALLQRGSCTLADENLSRPSATQS